MGGGPSGNIGGSGMWSSEFAFWNNARAESVKRLLNAQELSIWNILQDRVTKNKNNSSVLSKTGWGDNKLPRIGGGPLTLPPGTMGTSSSNPMIVKSFEEAKIYSGGSDQKFTKLTGPGLEGVYSSKSISGETHYYVIKPKGRDLWGDEKSGTVKKTPQTPQTPQQQTMTGVSSNLYIPSNTSTKTTVGVKKVKDLAPVKPKLRSEYDLLFNTLDYQTSFDAEIKEMAMDLIFAGDDLLDNFNYESIDYLPDYDVDVNTKQGYFNAYSNYKKQSLGTDFEKLEPEEEGFDTFDGAQEETEIAAELIYELERKIGSGVKQLDLLKIFGSWNASGKTFNVGVSTGLTVDFYYELDSKYDDLDIEIHFDLI